MSYTCLYNNHGTQVLPLPPQFKFDTNYVTLEAVDDGILIKPVKEKLTPERLFAMIDEALGEDGEFVIDRSTNVPPGSRDLF